MPHMGQTRPFASVDPALQLHPHQQTFAATIMSSHSADAVDLTSLSGFGKISVGRVAIAHAGPKRRCDFRGCRNSLKADGLAAAARRSATLPDGLAGSRDGRGSSTAPGNVSAAAELMMIGAMSKSARPFSPATGVGPLLDSSAVISSGLLRASSTPQAPFRGRGTYRRT
jgi:hypothetical protein